MICPECKKDLEQHDFRGIQIHECLSCKGRWFDKDELRKAKDKTDKDLCWLDFDPFGKDSDHFKVIDDGQGCPQCSAKMSILTYENSKVTIEECSECEGVWLHHGEFEKIIRYLENLILTKSTPEYVKDTLKQFLEIINGPENVVSEIKDFLVVTKLLELRIGVEHPEISEAAKKIYQYFPFI